MLNSTPRVSAAVTVLVPKRYLTFITIIAGILMALGIGIAYKSLERGWTLTADGRSYELLIADTDDTRKRGLSGTSQLDSGRAMLFVFPQQSQQCIWMKDMRYNIDIMWLDGDYRVTGLEQNVAPATYPNSFCHDARYVLEFTTGELSRIKLGIGDTVNLHP